MTSVGQNGFVFHHSKVFFGDNLFVAGYGQEVVAQRCSVHHFHHLKTVHDSFNGFDWVHFCYDNFCAQAFSAHSSAFAAPAKAGENHSLTSHY